MRVLVLADRGLWSPTLWQELRRFHWHPLLRIQNHMTFAASGRDRCPVSALVQPGQAWVGRGRLGLPKRARLSVTLVMVWTADQKAPWAVVTNLKTNKVGVSGYALRMWVELLFRFLKRTLNGIHLIRHDQRGVTIQFYALMITALLELHLKQLVLDHYESQAQQDGFKPSHPHTRSGIVTPPVRGGYLFNSCRGFHFRYRSPQTIIHVAANDRRLRRNSSILGALV